VGLAGFFYIVDLLCFFIVLHDSFTRLYFNQCNFFSESDDSIVSSLLMFLLSNIRVTFCFVSAIAGSSGLLGAR